MKNETTAILNLADCIVPGGRTAFLEDLRGLILEDKLYTPAQVAEMWGISLSCVRSWSACGE